MAQLDINHAAFTGFRLTRRYPMMIAVWSVILLVIMLGARLAIANGDFEQVRALFEPGGPFDPAAIRPADPEAARVQAAAHLAQINAADKAFLPISVVLTPVMLLFFSFLTTALYRSVLTPRHCGPGFLGFGLPEFRQVLVMLLMHCFFFLASFLYVSATGVVIGMIGAFSAPVSGFFALVAFFGGLALLFKAMAHLSMAGPATFTQGAVRVLRVWGLVKEHFWPVFGAYLLASIMGLLVALLGLAVLIGLFAAGGGVEAAGGLPSSTAEVFAPMALFTTALSAVFWVMLLIIWLSPPAEIYRQLTDRTEDAF